VKFEIEIKLRLNSNVTEMRSALRDLGFRVSKSRVYESNVLLDTSNRLLRSHGKLIRVRRVGPRSVGYRLTSRALCFGGDTTTATDVAVAAGRLSLGYPNRVRRLSPSLITCAMLRMDDMISEGVDRMKTDATAIPLLAVGGGSFLVPASVPGTSDVIRVEHHDVANAVGAAIAQVSGEVDRIFTGVGRTKAIEQAQAEATQRALDAGADPKTINVLDVDDIPIAYLPGDARRVRVRVVADIASFS